MEISKIKNNTPSSRSNIINYTKQTPSLNISLQTEKLTLSKNQISKNKNSTIHSYNISEILNKNFNGSITNKSRNYESNIDLSILSTSKSYNRSKSELLYSLNNKKKVKNNNNSNLKYNKKSMPIITEKNIKKNSNKFYKKFNPLNKINKLDITEREIFGKDNNIYNKENKKNKKQEFFSFKPKLSKNSIRIAEKLESSFIRLNKIPIKNIYDKSNNTKIIEVELIEKKYLDLKNKKNNSRNNKLNINFNYTNPSESLYQKGIKKIIEKEKKRKKILEERENLYKTFSFSPNILRRKKKNVFYSNKKYDKSYDNFYKRNIQWKEKVRNKSEILLRKNTLKELKECSFTPKIYKKEIKNDISFILKNIEQINKYVRNRQEFLYKKQLIEIENEKKFFNVNYLKTHLPITNINKLKNKKTIIINDYFTQEDSKYK